MILNYEVQSDSVKSTQTVYKRIKVFRERLDPNQLIGDGEFTFEIPVGIQVEFRASLRNSVLAFRHRSAPDLAIEAVNKYSCGVCFLPGQ